MSRSTLRYSVAICGLLVIVAGARWGYRQWRSANRAETEKKPATAGMATMPVRLSAQARKNLQLVSKPAELSTYWRNVEFPGVIVDWPGITDRGVTTPVTGVVTKVHAFPGDAVEPNAPLVTLRLISETLQSSQLELYKATKEIELLQRQLKRLSSLAASGAVAGARIIEVENQIQRQSATVDAYRQDLQARGLPEDRIAAAGKGDFVTEIVVRAPGAQSLKATDAVLAKNTTSSPNNLPFKFEVQSLAAELGEQVSAGKVLCQLADHRALLIEGRGFKDDMRVVQKAAQNGWPVETDFERSDDQWPPFPSRLPIHHVANVVDPQTRTFGFYIALANQSKSYLQGDEARLLWRFRPGVQLRLRVPVEKMRQVFVVPQSAIVYEGPEAFVFRQNGEFYDRRTVHVLHEDRMNVVLANDGSIRPGFYIAQNGAASLNRVLKAQASTGLPAGVHVHPDGTVHGAH